MESRVNGYEKLAGLMSQHAEVATFQRFDFLNTLNLLFLQAELVHLEHDLKDSMKEDLDSSNEQVLGILDDAVSVEQPGEEDIITARDRDIKIPLSHMNTKSSSRSESSTNERYEAGRDWHYLSRLENNQTWGIMLRTREKLREYNEAILKQKQMKAQDSPNDCDIVFLRRWFADKNMGNFPLIGRDSYVWDTHPSELISLKARKGEDPLGSLFISKVFVWWHNSIGHRIKQPVDEEAQYFTYTDKHILRAANILGSVISSSLLIGSILALYFVESTLVRLGIVAAFTQIFSLVLILVTNARKVEVFAATAAFVAVLVVFVGSTYSPMPVPTP